MPPIYLEYACSRCGRGISTRTALYYVIDEEGQVRSVYDERPTGTYYCFDCAYRS
jgi:DNA-directed RNA polymerase subunit RPC12/RpoP